MGAVELTTTSLEVAAVKLPLAKLIVIVAAALGDRSVKVTTPLTADRLVVPCKTPLPVARLAITVVPLSLLRRLPN